MGNTLPPHYRWNFTLGILNGALVNFALAFIDPYTVLPVFITRMGGSDVIVGLASALYSAGWFLPQFFVARYVESQPFSLPIYRHMSGIRIMALGAIVASVYVLGTSHPTRLLFLVVSCFAISTLAAGVTGVPFLEVTTRAIPTARRGMFFGLRRLVGGALGVVAGLVVSVVLGGDVGTAPGWPLRVVDRAAARLKFTGHEFPFDYGVLFACAAVLSALGYVAYSFVREPPGPGSRPRRSVREHVRAGVSLLVEHANYRLFLWVRVCWQLTAMAFPFYATFVLARLGYPDASIGLFVSIWVGSGVLANFVWGHMMDRHGNRVVLVSTAAMSAVGPIAFLWIAAQGSQPDALTFWVVASTFFLNGSARSGRFISNMTYLLEFAPDAHRPLYVGFMNTISAPFALSPVLGGVIIGVTSFEVLFAIAAVFAVAGVFLSARLVEPRMLSRTAAPTVEAP